MSLARHSSQCRHRLFVGTNLVMMLIGMTSDQTNAAGTLFWSSGYIRRSSTEGQCRQSIQASVPGQGISEIDIDLEMGKVYFTHSSLHTIRRCDLDGQNVEVLYSGTLAEPLALDIDHINRKLYWTEYGTQPAQNRIMRSNLDGSNVEFLLSGFRVPHGIATDPAGGKVYWTQGFFETVSGSIHRANLDGTAHEQIVTVEGQVPIGIAVHHTSSRVYWTDGRSGDTGRFGAIYRANLDGSNVEQMLPGLQGLRHIDIDEVGGKLYFGRQVQPANVFRCDLDGRGFVALGLGAAHGIACVSEEHGFVCPGDTNSDLSVNIDDLLLVINSWGPCRSCPADFNDDGIVNIDDLLFVVNHWTI